jgi:hypothetical protein
MVDITDPSFTHFGNFQNVNLNNNAYSKISEDYSLGGEDYGWRYLSWTITPVFGGALFDESHVVTQLSIQSHLNAFTNFTLLGSTDTTDGFDGNWDVLLSSIVTERTDLAVQDFPFSNTKAYSAYRLQADNWNGGGWAVYRWKLWADKDTGASIVPEPVSSLLFAGGFMGLFLRRRKRS